MAHKNSRGIFCLWLKVICSLLNLGSLSGQNQLVQYLIPLTPLPSQDSAEIQSTSPDSPGKIQHTDSTLRFFFNVLWKVSQSTLSKLHFLLNADSSHTVIVIWKHVCRLRTVSVSCVWKTAVLLEASPCCLLLCLAHCSHTVTDLGSSWWSRPLVKHQP